MTVISVTTTRPNLRHSAQSAPVRNTDSRATLWARLRTGVRAEPALLDSIVRVPQSTGWGAPKGQHDFLRFNH